MKTLKHIAEGMFADSIHEGSNTHGIREGMFDIDNNLDKIGRESIILQHFEKEDIYKNLKFWIEKDVLFMNFDERSEASMNFYLAFNGIDFKALGVNKIKIVSDKPYPRFEMWGEKDEIVDSRKGFVKEIEIDGDLSFDYNNVNRRGWGLRNVRIKAKQVGAKELRTALWSNGWNGCEFECDGMYVALIGEEKAQFKINCKDLRIIRESYSPWGGKLEIFHDMEAVEIKDKSNRIKAEDLLDLKSKWYRQGTCWLNFEGRKGVDVYKEFEKEYFPKGFETKRFSIDFCETVGRGNYWHLYMNCNGRTWTCAYYGR